MLNELQVGEFLAALGERTPTPASGAATALTGALAAALTELAARFAEDDDAVMRAKAHVMRLLQLADEDAAAYTAFMMNGSRPVDVAVAPHRPTVSGASCAWVAPMMM